MFGFFNLTKIHYSTFLIIYLKMLLPNVFVPLNNYVLLKKIKIHISVRNTLKLFKIKQKGI